jgi:hypothetical protein
MLRQKSLLVSLVLLVDRLPWESVPAQRSRGRPKTYSDRLIVKALVIMIIRRLYTAYAMLAFLNQDDPLPRQLRGLLCEHGRFPSRRTWERRLAALPPNLPGLIGCFGRHLVTLMPPWARDGRAVAVDSTALQTGGGVWHKKHREQGVVPHSSIDTEAGWSKSGWHGWWYGWKLHLAVTVGALWIPLAAELTVANRGDNEVAPLLLQQLRGKCAMCWATPTTMTLSCGSSATRVAVSWSPPGAARIPIAMGEGRSGKCFTNCARKPSNLSMACTKTSLSGG